MKLLPMLFTLGVASTIGLCDLCAPAGATAAEAAPAAPSALASAAGLESASPLAALDTVTLRVEGMTCGGCTLATRKVLERLDGVTKAEVSYEQKTAVVIYDPTKVTTAQMIQAVATLKYTATVVKS
jgi:mercuric transport protein